MCRLHAGVLLSSVTSNTSRVSITCNFFINFREMNLYSLLRHYLSKTQQTNSFILSRQFHTCWKDDEANCSPQTKSFWRSTALVWFSCRYFVFLLLIFLSLINQLYVYWLHLSVLHFNVTMNHLFNKFFFFSFDHTMLYSLNSY